MITDHAEIDNSRALQIGNPIKGFPSHRTQNYSFGEYETRSQPYVVMASTFTQAR